MILTDYENRRVLAERRARYWNNIEWLGHRVGCFLDAGLCVMCDQAWPCRAVYYQFADNEPKGDPLTPPREEG